MRVLLITVACLAATAAAGNMDKYQQRTGRKFLHEKSTEEGVHKLPSGMLMKVLKRGTGKDGTTFDSSYDRGTPTAFAPSQVIKGWTEALQLMCEGDKWQ
eukprot:gene12963-19995_t